MTDRTSSPESSLRRSIGPLALAASIVNVTIGAGIFRLPADMAATLGATAFVAYLLCALMMGLIVLCMAEAGSRVSLTGGLYAYVEVAFGPFVGFLAGFLLWMVLTFAMAAVGTVLMANLGALCPQWRRAPHQRRCWSASTPSLRRSTSWGSSEAHA